jgi:Family of unknown function (DUF6526)
MAQPQSFKNHAKFDPSFHFFLAPVALFMVIGTIVQCVRNPSWMSAAHILVALWALVATFKIRLYALKVQDRVIRLEERLRLKELAPALQGKIAELNEDQLIGLRFASDGEVAGLAAQALASNWNRKQVKQAIKNWRPDYWRV